MTLEQILAQLRKEAGTLRDKLLNKSADFTAADGARAEELGREISDTERRITAKNSASAALGSVTGPLYSSTDNDAPADDPRQPFRATARKAAGVTDGQHAKAAAFAGNLMKALEQAAPTIGGPSVGKALVPSGAVTAGFDARIVEDPRAAHSVINAVAARPVDAPSGSYLRTSLIGGRQNAAAAVINGDLKPISKYGLEKAGWEMATVATVSEPIQHSWLQDYAGLEAFLAAEMTWGVEAAVTRFILNGGMSEEGKLQEGVLTAAGVGQTAYSRSAMLSVRSALGQLEAAGVTATGIVHNPLDWEQIETTQDADGRFLLLSAPTTAPVRTLWNVPVTLSPDMPRGQSVVGDLSTITLLYRSSILLAFNPYHTDMGTKAAPIPTPLFRLNQTQFRAEVRVAVEIASPRSLRVVDLTA